MDVGPIPNLAYYLVVNVRENMCQLRQIGQSFAQQGWQESNPRPPGWSRLSVPLDYTPSSACCMSWHSAQEHKRAAPFRKRLLNELDVYVLVMPLRAPPGVGLRPTERLRIQLLGHDAPARRRKTSEVF
jgi:hypothetical protein